MSVAVGDESHLTYDCAILRLPNGTFMENTLNENYRKIWRNPAIESTNIYDGLVVQDNRVGGSITVRSSRLPLWTLIRTAIQENWGVVQESWDVNQYNYSAEEFSEFLYNLLEARGEFARLLLEIAHANRENIHWWTDRALSERVRDQLQICADSLDTDGRTLQPPDTLPRNR